jgi:hypothetical protein
MAELNAKEIAAREAEERARQEAREKAVAAKAARKRASVEAMDRANRAHEILRAEDNERDMRNLLASLRR